MIPTKSGANKLRPAVAYGTVHHLIETACSLVRPPNINDRSKRQAHISATVMTMQASASKILFTSSERFKKYRTLGRPPYRKSAVTGRQSSEPSKAARIRLVDSFIS